MARRPLPPLAATVALLAADGNRVTVHGVTTGSHLNLPDDEELALPVTWIAEVDEGRLALWQIA